MFVESIAIWDSSLLDHFSDSLRSFSLVQRLAALRNMALTIAFVVWLGWADWLRTIMLMVIFSQWLRILTVFCCALSLRFITVYLNPACSALNSEQSDQSSHSLTCNDPCFICEDFNMPSLRWNNELLVLCSSPAGTFLEACRNTN